MGRFINKDPIEEQGGLNLYGFCGNNGINRYDMLGQYEVEYGEDGSITFKINNYTDAGDNWSSYTGYGQEWLDYMILSSAGGAVGFEEFENITAPRGAAAIMGGSGFDNASSINLSSYAAPLQFEAWMYDKWVDPAVADKIPTVRLGPLVILETDALSSEETIDPFNATGRRGLFESQARADMRFDAQVTGGIKQIQADLLNNASRTLDWEKSVGILNDYSRFTAGLMNYTIKFEETRGPGGGGANSARTFGLVQWDPGYTNVMGGVRSAPHIILAHEVWHVIDRLEFSNDLTDRFRATDAGPLTNILEARAIEFENKVRTSGPPRTSHDPSKPGP